MATLMPSRIAALSQDHLDSESLVTALRPWRRRLTLQQVVSWFTGGIIAGLVLACLLLLISRLLPWTAAPYWAMGVGIACVILALTAALWYRPSISGTARIIDGRLELHDRLGTAWELRDQSSALAKLQRRDALKQLQKHTPAKALSLRFRRSTLIFFGVVALALALLIALPNPMTSVIQQQAAFQAHLAQQVAAVEKLRQDLAHQASITSQQQQQIEQILRDLEKQLQQAKNETQAEQAIAEAQAKLDQLRNPQAVSQAQANAAASSSLQNSGNSSLSAIGQALANNNSKALSSSLQNLASQVSQLSPSQRSQLSQQIEQAANQASQNPNLSSALHQLAKAVADNSQGDISDAANAVQAASAQNAATQNAQGTINQAAQGLQQAANNLAASTDNSNNQGQQGQQGQGQGQGQQGQQGQGQGQQGQQGQGGQGQGGQGGANGANNGLGKNEQVFVPGQLGSGASTQSNGGNNGAIESGSSVPYSQVIEEYSQMAHDAIDNSDVSPDMKDLVHNYFDELEGQGQ